MKGLIPTRLALLSRVDYTVVKFIEKETQQEDYYREEKRELRPDDLVYPKKTPFISTLHFITP